MKALVVEDDAEIARLVAQALTQEGFETDHCLRGSEALGRASGGDYAVILLDWTLPDVDGLTVCKTLRSAGSVTPILMLTARGEVHERILGLDTGADDYLVKPFDVEELLGRVRALTRRARSFTRLSAGDLEIDRLQQVVRAAGQSLDLTSREFALLMHFVRHRGRVVSRTELLAHVWLTHLDPGSHVVEVHISRLRDKLGPRAWMIETVRGQGYRLREEPP